MDDMTKIKKAANFIKKKINGDIDIAIVLGSGLSDLADIAHDCIEIDYKDIPGFPVSTVTGHAGKLIYGKIGDVRVLMMKGRIHYYEGYEMKQVTFPMRVFNVLGIKKVILTNAAGAVNTSYKPGDIVIIKDHINLGMRNPLIGKNFDEFGPRFPDMSNVYDKEFIEKVKQIESDMGLNVNEGVYTYLTGPNYETPSEVKMVRILGGDMVGMSTVPEAIVASHQKMRVLGLSCMTNMAAGILDKPLDHKEVLEVSEMVKDKMMKLTEAIIKELGK